MFAAPGAWYGAGVSRIEIVRRGRATVLFDGATYPEFDPSVFDDRGWHSDRTLAHTKTGRGGVRMLERGNETWVRRHYHRGGLVARLVYDHYLWRGLDRSRPARELRLLATMRDLELPVPAPVAGRVVLGGLIYRADLISVLLPGTYPLSNGIAAADVDPAVWPRIGSMLARFHGARVDHPDLTAHNILLDAAGQPYLLDFDNARLRDDAGWQDARIARLHRSLNKVALETGTTFDPNGWDALFDAYTSR